MNALREAALFSAVAPWECGLLGSAAVQSPALHSKEPAGVARSLGSPPMILACGKAIQPIEALLGDERVEIIGTRSLQAAVTLLEREKFAALATSGTLIGGTAFDLFSESARRSGSPIRKLALLMPGDRWEPLIQFSGGGIIEILDGEDPLSLFEAIAPAIGIGKKPLRAQLHGVVRVRTPDDVHDLQALDIRPSGIAIRSLPPISSEAAVLVEVPLGHRVLRAWAQLARRWCSRRGDPRAALHFIGMSPTAQAKLRLAIAMLD